jgi:hypothetical protein
MHPTQFDPHSLPRYVPIPKACDLLGIGRTKLYEYAGDGLIRVVKAGGRSLVDIEQALGWMATLPTAAIAPQHRKTIRACQEAGLYAGPIYQAEGLAAALAEAIRLAEELDANPSAAVGEREVARQVALKIGPYLQTLRTMRARA